MRWLAGLGSAALNRAKNIDPLQATMLVGPDALYAGIAAATAPGGFNPLVGLEEFAIGLGGTGLGWGTRKGIERFAGDRWKQLDPSWQNAIGFGTDALASVPVNMFAPRPALMSAIEAQTRQQQEQQQLLAEQQQFNNMEQLGSLAFAGGLLASPAFAPSPSLGMGLNTLV